MVDLPEILEELYCPECGYNLRGLVSDRCPECGRTFDRQQLATSQIPWAYRPQTGWLRAYWRTVWRVTFENKRFCREVCRPVDFRDAQLFRWVTCLHACVPLLVAVVGIRVFGGPTPFNEPFIGELYKIVWPIAAGCIGLALFLAAATGVPSYFCHPKHLTVEQQDRCIALSYYGTAALAWTPLTLGLLVANHLFQQWARQTVYGPIAFPVAIIAAVAAQSGFLVFAPVLIARRSAQRGLVGTVGMLMLLPVLWFALACLTILGTAGVFAFVGFVFLSFRT